MLAAAARGDPGGGWGRRQERESERKGERHKRVEGKGEGKREQGTQGMDECRHGAHASGRRVWKGGDGRADGSIPGEQ